MVLPAPLKDALTLYLDHPPAPEMVSSLGEYARFAREEMEPVAWDVDRRARPHLQSHDLLGSDIDEVILNDAHRRTLAKMYTSGIATGPAEGRHPWWYTFALGYLTTDVGMFCSATVTMATVFSMEKYASPHVREMFREKLMESGGIRQGATWVTEAQGGSDIGANATVARPANDGYFLLTGEKYFCSNVGAEFAIVTARPEGAPPGARGIGLFLVPSLRRDGRANWRIRRLKDKLGTVAVPTGEVSLIGSEGYPLGPQELGIHPTMEMLNLSRICNSLGSAAQISRAFDWALEHARKREAFGKKLGGHPLMAQDLARLHAMAEATALLAFDPAFAFDAVWKERPPYPETYQSMRFATHAAKLITAEQAVRETSLAMEILGGSGYLEEFPIAKLMRDTLVTPVWEGGANVQALDACEVIVRSHPEEAWRKDALSVLDTTDSPQVRDFMEKRLKWLSKPIEIPSSKVKLRAWSEVREMTLMRRLFEKLKASREVGQSERLDALSRIFAFTLDGNAGEGIPVKTMEKALSGVYNDPQ